MPRYFPHPAEAVLQEPATLENLAPCPYRMIASESAADTAHCGLTLNLVPAASDDDCRVTPATCRGCDQVAVSWRGRLSPVVASLVCEAVSRVESRSPPAASLTTLAETRAWATRFLGGGPGDAAVAQHDSARRSARWLAGVRQRLWPRTQRIGMVGPNNQRGLGHQNRDLARWLPIERWLAPNGVGGVTAYRRDGVGWRVDFSAETGDAGRIENWLRDLDVLVFAESPLLEGLTRLARKGGVRVVAIPNWERLDLSLEWLDDVDLMLCPTMHTKRVLDGWKQRFGFHWQTHYVHWPIDLDRFPFRLRSVCRQFVFVNGSGGMSARQLDGAPTSFRRKGLELLLEAARRTPQIPILVWSQTCDLPPLPANVTLRRAAAVNAQMYDEGDVCVQPSHWEGIGLPLLECQAAGLPLVTVDAPPMNEHHPWATIPVASTETILLSPLHRVAVPRPSPDDLAEVLESLHGTSISEASRAARGIMETHHSWRASRRTLLELIRS